MKKIVFILCVVLLIGSTSVMQALDVIVTNNQDPTDAGKTTLLDAINMVNSSGDATRSISFKYI